MDFFGRAANLATATGAKIKSIMALIGTATLTTADTTLKGAINELNTNKATKADTYSKSQVDSALSGKQNNTDNIHSARLTGLIDPSLIPVFSYFKPYISTAASISALSSSDQSKISTDGKNGTTNAVTLSDGSTYLFTGGTSTDIANYILLTDVTPDWTTIANRPTTVAASGLTDAVTTAQIGNDVDLVAVFNAALA